MLMNPAKWLRRRIRILFRRDDVEGELSEELRLHVDMEAQDLMRQGRTAEEARREARILLGGLEQTKEAVRDRRPLHSLDGVGLDLRLGLRILRKSWGLTLIGGMAMAIAIGIGTAAFAYLDAYGGDTLPFPEGDRVVRLMIRGWSGVLTSAQDLQWWRKELRSVEEISAFRTIERLLVTGASSDARVSVAQMTASGFRVTRVPPLAGRVLSEEDERAGAAQVAVLGYDVWQKGFAGNRAAIGRTVQLGGVDHLVVGVMPEDFAFPINHQVWVPFRSDPQTDARADVMVFGRLRAGASVENAQAEMVVKGPAPLESRAKEDESLRVQPYARSLAPVPLWWSAIPIGLALLLVPPCANIAILIYARNVSRQEEFAARYVLGAGRGRIVGQLLIEAFVLSAAAAGAGLLVAQQLLERFQFGQDASFPFWVNPDISLKTVLYVTTLAAFAAIVAGGIPALRATGRMGFQGMGSRSSPKLGKTWTALVVLQVALSTAILPRFGEFIWTFLNPYVTGRDFAANEFVTARVVQDAERPRDLAPALIRQIQERTGAAGLTVSTSIDGIDEPIWRFETDFPGRAQMEAGTNQVDTAYFNVFDARLLAGRAFETADFASGHPVVIVDRAFAEELGGESPLGKRVRHRTRDGAEDGPWHEIVGIVDQISPSGQRPFVYYPLPPAQKSIRLTLRLGPTVPSDLARRLVSVTTEVDRTLQVEEIHTLEKLYADERREEDLFGLSAATILLVVLLFSAQASIRWWLSLLRYGGARSEFGLHWEPSR